MNKKPISELTDNQLLRLVKNENSSEAFLEIVNRHEKLFFNMCSKYAKKSQFIEYDEVIKDSYFVIGEAIRTYKQNRKTKISTWICHYSRFFLLKKIAYLSKTQLEMGLDDITLDKINMKDNHFNEIKILDIKDRVTTILDSLPDKRIKKIFECRYFSDKSETWNDISKKLNVSATYIINLHDKGCSIIKKLLESKDIN